MYHLYYPIWIIYSLVGTSELVRLVWWSGRLRQNCLLSLGVKEQPGWYKEILSQSSNKKKPVGSPWPRAFMCGHHLISFIQYAEWGDTSVSFISLFMQQISTNRLLYITVLGAGYALWRILSIYLSLLTVFLYHFTLMLTPKYRLEVSLLSHPFLSLVLTVTPQCILPSSSSTAPTSTHP